jgi:hypothetical protein
MRHIFNPEGGEITLDKGGRKIRSVGPIFRVWKDGTIGPMTIDTDRNNVAKTSPKTTNSTPDEAGSPSNFGVMQPGGRESTERELLERYADYVRQSALTTSNPHKQMIRLFILALVEAEIDPSD